MTRPRAGSPARGFVLAALAAFLLVPAAAHAGVSAQSSGGVVEIEIDTHSFSPDHAVIAPGTTVRWTNVGEERHTVAPDAGSQFGIEDLEPGESYEFTFETPGTYGYSCHLHGAPGIGEFGTIRVTGGIEPPPDRPDVTASGAGTTIRVPQDEPTIQRAVDISTPGSLILVAPGVYQESVLVGPKHPDIVIRGVDRATTILDGRLSTEPGAESGIKVLADGVAIENMTARNYLSNGFLWIRVDGYRGSYLSAVRNGEYGIYAFESTHGQFDHSYASGSGDAGFYIGQCERCAALIVDSEAEWNGLGYSGTNAGDVVLARSEWHDNRVGIAPNTGAGDRPPPDAGTTIVGNRVFDNANATTPAVELAADLFGSGIVLAGSTGNIVERNLVTGHPALGIGVIPLPGPAGQPEFDARDNSVRDNVLFANGVGLASFASFDDALDTGGNCFSGNSDGVTAPADLQVVLPCDAASAFYRAPLELLAALFLSAKPPVADFRTVTLPDPPRGANMPKPRRARVRPATNEPSIRLAPGKVELPTP